MTAPRDRLSVTFAALADPTRRRILSMLVEGDKTVTQLAEPFQITQPAISKHLKVLERAGLIERGREAQWRPAILRAEPLRTASAWMEQYRQHWERISHDPEAPLLNVFESQAPDQDGPAQRIGRFLTGILRKLAKAIGIIWADSYSADE